MSILNVPELVKEHEQIHRPAGRLTIKRETCETCAILDALIAEHRFHRDLTESSWKERTRAFARLDFTRKDRA